MPQQTIDSLKSIGTVLFVTGGTVSISLTDIESYLRITALAVGIVTSLYVFYKNNIK